ncbi:MAG TPA: hypothetical protein VGG33_24850 [Polyangia bacterium]
MATVQTPRPPSAKVLEKALSRERGELTVADAAARAGLPLRDAEEGLRYLAAEFGGHLAATDKGEILYSFPGGLVRPPETRWWRRALASTGKAVMGVGRFIVRAWVSVVLVAYAIAFLALLIAISLKSDRDEGPGEAIGIVLRVIAEALYWTFHPFSPVYLNREPGWMNPRRGRHRGPRVPFYEKVNRFVFGPRPPERDPLEDERNVVAELRRQSGRVSPADVMRVTGLPREAAERLMLRLVVDYQGDLEVADTGAIIYRFSDLRSTARMGESAAVPAPFWNGQSVLRPLTGNEAGSNFLFGAINGFNLLGSVYALGNGLTLERIGEMIARTGERFPTPLPPPDGTPLVFGLVPFVFSTALFALPLMRALRRPKEKQRVGRENGWRGVLRLAIAGRRGSLVQTKAEVEAAWIAAGGHPPTEAELTEAVRAAGGDVDVGEDGQIIYRFDQVEGELRASAEQRQAASAREMSPGEVVFSSADEGPGLRDESPRGDGGGQPGQTSTTEPVGHPARPALPERGEEIPGGRVVDSQKESVDELLARIGVDTRRRGG